MLAKTTGAMMFLPTRTTTAEVVGVVEVVATVVVVAAATTITTLAALPLLVDLVMDNGATESTSLVRLTPVSSVSFSVPLPTILPSSTPVSTSRSTTIFQLRLPARMSLSLFTSSPPLLWTSIFAATSSSLTTRSPLLSRSTRSPSLATVVI